MKMALWPLPYLKAIIRVAINKMVILDFISPPTDKIIYIFELSVTVFQLYFLSIIYFYKFTKKKYSGRKLLISNHSNYALVLLLCKKVSIYTQIFAEFIFTVFNTLLNQYELQYYKF